MLNKRISLDEKVAKLSLKSVLVFTWMIPYQDVKGRMIALSETIKGSVFPLMECMTLKEIKKSLSEIEKVGLIQLYGKDKMYLQINGFHKNQKINDLREAPSDIPSPDELMINSGSTPEQLCTNSEVEVKGKREVKGKEQKITHLDFVLLKPSEYNKLISIYNKQTVDKYIEKLNSYIGSKGRKYHSHYFTLIAWLQKDDVPRLIKKEFKNPLALLD